MNQEQKADKWTDKELARLETRIRAQYEQAEREISAKANAYFAKYQKRWERENLALETTRHTKEEIEDMWYKLYGNTAGFEIWYKTADHAYGQTWQEAKAAFARWEYAQLGRGDDWIELQAQMSQRLTQSTQIAAGYINGILPKVYAEANNAIATLATQSAMDQGVMGVRFDLVDEYTVRFLMESSSEVRPCKPVVISLEQTTRWSKNKLQNALLQGILQGDSIGKIAERFSVATGMSRSMAIRNARTAVTGARSKGKQDRYEELESKGAFVTKVWVATEDDRTRPEHAQADGQEVDTDSAFDVGGEELMYPADPSGSPWNIVNCRCTMQTGEIRFKSTLSDEQRKKANIRIVEG